MTPAAPALVRIPTGPFVMGSTDGGEDERPEHEVTIEAFCIGVTPVTHGEYAAFVRATGARAPGVFDVPAIVREGAADDFRRAAAPYAWTGHAPPAGLEQHPVVLVSWDDAVAYCAWLADTMGRPFRLPTEAEWEKAARGGLDRRRYPWGDDIDLSQAHFAPHPQQRAGRGTSPVRAHPPNAFGVFGMAGNVWDWVNDWFDPAWYLTGASRQPGGPGAGALRVVRGGSWTNADVNYLRCAYRHPVPPDTYAYSIGFRVACADGD